MENNKDWKERFEELFVDIDMESGTWDWKEESDWSLASQPYEGLKELEDFITHEIEEAERRGREEENKRCVKLIGEIIQNTAWEAPQQFFDGLRSARESIKLEDLTSKEEKK